MVSDLVEDWPAFAEARARVRAHLGEENFWSLDRQDQPVVSFPPVL